MDDDDAGDLVRRLTERFPHEAPERIVDAVRRAKERLDTQPIQGFTPVLAEHAAVTELRRPG